VVKRDFYLLSNSDDIYGKIMTIPDDMMTEYFKMSTEMRDEEALNFKFNSQPMTARMLAWTLTAITHVKRFLPAADLFLKDFSSNYAASTIGSLR